MRTDIEKEKFSKEFSEKILGIKQKAPGIAVERPLGFGKCEVPKTVTVTVSESEEMR